MVQALDCQTGKLARKITSAAFKRGLIVETSGSDDHVVKCLMPLTITYENLERGLDILEESAIEALSSFSDERSGNKNVPKIEVLA